MGQLLQLVSILNVPITYLLAVEDIDGNMLPTYFADPDDFEFIKMLGLDSPAGRQAFFSKQFEGGPLESRIKRAWTQLNDAGKEKVAERIEELVEIPRYRRQGESFPGSEIPKKAD